MLGPALAVLLLFAAPAAGEPLPADLPLNAHVAAATALDGDTVRLADGRELRLAGIAAPRQILPRGGSKPIRDSRLESLADAARQALDAWVRDQPLAVHGTPSTDRHGRVVAHVGTAEQGWLQAALLARGFARVQTTEMSAAGAAAMLRIEAEARRARRGIWGHPLFQVRSAEDTARWLDTFQLVEGPVAAVQGGRSSRLEIGDSDRRVAVVLTTPARRELREAGIDPAGLLGRQVRVRGWIEWQSGPRIDLTHAAALEILD